MRFNYKTRRVLQLARRRTHRPLRAHLPLPAPSTVPFTPFLFTVPFHSYLRFDSPYLLYQPPPPFASTLSTLSLLSSTFVRLEIPEGRSPRNETLRVLHSHCIVFRSEFLLLEGSTSIGRERDTLTKILFNPLRRVASIFWASLEDRVIQRMENTSHFRKYRLSVILEIVTLQRQVEIRSSTRSTPIVYTTAETEARQRSVES